MQVSLESLAALATIVGTVLSMLALIQARKWLVMIALSLVSVAIIAGFYARRDRNALKAATITVEGRSIDALNAANLRRTINRTLFIQEVHHTARIEGEDLIIEWTYSGYCRAKQASAIEFTIAAEPVTPFERLDCVAYDLGNDSTMKHEIRPLLVGSDGISKRLSVPFLQQLKSHQAFTVMLKCVLPRAMKVGFGYYTLMLSFAQDRIRRCTVRLIFAGSRPTWVRVYESSPPRPPTLLNNLAPNRQGQGECDYLDMIEDAPGQSARVYAFWREAIQT